MTGMSDDLVAFLRARLDEQEHGVRELQRRAQEHRRAAQKPAVLGTYVPGWYDWPEVDQMCATVLAQVAAHRRIVDLYAGHANYDTEDWPYEGATGRIHGLGEAVRLLAAIGSDHPDYRPEWSPEPGG